MSRTKQTKVSNGSATRSGQQAATIKDVAAHIGISYATVSRALNDHAHTSKEVKARVAEAVKELGYVPHVGARMMRARHSPLVGLVIPDLTNQIFVSTAAIVAEQCTAAGLQLVVSISGRDPQRECELVEALREIRAAGVIIAPCGDSLPRTIELLKQMPCVQLGARNSSFDGPTMAVDDRSGAAQAALHLAQLGHTRIAFLGGAGGVGTHDTRLAGAREGLASVGLTLDDSLVFTGPVTQEFGQSSMSRLLAVKPCPTAVLVANSVLTLGAIKAIHQAGVLVPKDLSLVGFGDLDTFRLWGPGLTTVDLPIEEFARAAAFHLFEQMRQGEDFSPPDPFTITHEVSLIVRGSTAPPRKADSD